MTYLSRIKLDTNKRKTLQALSSLNLFHGAVELSFPESRGRNLWRIDQLGGSYYLLMVSPERPELGSFREQFGEDVEGSIAVRDYQRFLMGLKEGDIWHFRITANPTVAANGDVQTKKRGKVTAHITTEYQKKWLINKAANYGFQLDSEQFDVVNRRWYSFRKHVHGARVTLLGVSYEGSLQIIDTDRFRVALTEGIGRGKAYGMGMLTVASKKRCF